MAATKTLYGVITILVAALLLTSSAGMYYYLQFSQASGNSASYLSLLGREEASYNSTAAEYGRLVSSYDSLSGAYNGSLSGMGRMISVYNSSVAEFDSLTSTYSALSGQYNLTLSLLARSVATMNTSAPAYQGASRSLAGLWSNYRVLMQQYRDEVATFGSLLTSFRSVASSYGNLTGSSIRLANPPQLSAFPLPKVDILLDFGNGTARWYNGTEVQPGWNLYVATLVLTNGSIDAVWYPSYGAHFVTGVDGVRNTQTDFWFIWVRNGTSWTNPQTGADQVMMQNGSAYAWTFCPETPSFAPACSP